MKIKIIYQYLTRKFKFTSSLFVFFIFIFFKIFTRSNAHLFYTNNTIFFVNIYASCKTTTTNSNWSLNYLLLRRSKKIISGSSLVEFIIKNKLFKYKQNKIMISTSKHHNKENNKNFRRLINNSISIVSNISWSIYRKNLEQYNEHFFVNAQAKSIIVFKSERKINGLLKLTNNAYTFQPIISYCKEIYCKENFSISKSIEKE
jgi:hypothetical protein